eukprot:TRINITY_DN6141_c0_g1_i1.p1 TRINITY_DN6141_c0_g1~~TRINITY_DN6141_c0_g1_i1.p1  ORF type:complete len:378 (-),score=123.83 TRINITY_DN6141_c0_g1_i1:624-1727(-)
MEATHQLTELEIEKFKKKFTEIDKDGDGYFTLDDYLLYLTEKKRNQTGMESALHNTIVGIQKVKKKTKEFVNAAELKFEKSVYIKVVILSKNENERGWKQFLYKPYYEENAIMLRCFDIQNGYAPAPDYDIDFHKLKTVDVQHLEEGDKKNQYWFPWRVSSLPHEYACTSLRDLEEWTQNIRYLHNRIAVSKARIKAAETSGLISKDFKPKKEIDPVLLEELKTLDPFAPGKSKEEKEAIWNRINEIRDLIGDDVLDDGDGVNTESLSSSSSEDSDSEEGPTSATTTHNEHEHNTLKIGNMQLDITVLKKAATTTSRKVAEKTKNVAVATKEKSEVLSARTAVSARALKSSVGSLSKAVTNKIKKET